MVNILQRLWLSGCFSPVVIPDSQDFDYAVVVLSSIVKLCCWTTTMIVVVAVKRGTNNLKQKL